VLQKSGEYSPVFIFHHESRLKTIQQHEMKTLIAINVEICYQIDSVKIIEYLNYRKGIMTLTMRSFTHVAVVITLTELTFGLFGPVVRTAQILYQTTRNAKTFLILFRTRSNTSRPSTIERPNLFCLRAESETGNVIRTDSTNAVRGSRLVRHRESFGDGEFVANHCKKNTQQLTIIYTYLFCITIV